MASSRSNLVNNLSERIHRIKCKYDHDKKCETCGIKYKYCNCFLEYTNFEACVRYLLSILYFFHQMIALQKL